MRLLPLVVLALALFAPPATAQDFAVQNVRFEVEGTRVLILYDLVGEGEFDVAIQVSADAGRSFLAMNAVSGDVGPGVLAGTGRTIIWNVLADYAEGLAGDAVVFDVTATQASVKKGKGKLYLLLGALVAGAGGTAALVLGGGTPDDGGTGGTGGTGTTTQLPTPPGRPGGG